MKTTSETYPKSQVQSLIQRLIEESRWFEVEPRSYDVYAVTIKAESHLPAPVGIDNAGNPIDFEAWFEIVEHAYSEMTLMAKLEFRDLFVRGLSPAQAIELDHAEAE